LGGVAAAEAELISYCERHCAQDARQKLDLLNAQRACGAELLGAGDLRRQYGCDISMAHGTGDSTWRTSHLRARSSFLKEALDGVAPDGVWKLLHLRGTELVADGLTKLLSGHAFFRFVEDLGMKPRRSSSENGDEHQESGPSSGGGKHGNQSAMIAIMIGSLLESHKVGPPS